MNPKNNFAVVCEPTEAQAAHASQNGGLNMILPSVKFKWSSYL